MKNPDESPMISMPNPTRTAQTASRSLSVIGGIFGYSVNERKCSRGNTQSLLAVARGRPLTRYFLRCSIGTSLPATYSDPSAVRCA